MTTIIVSQERELDLIAYLYDGTPMGLITAIALTLRGMIDPRRSGSSPRLASARHSSKKYAVSQRIPSPPTNFCAVSPPGSPTLVWKELFICFFTGEPGMEDPIMAYARLLLASGGGAADNWADDTVRRVRQLSRRVLHEIRRLHGFIRFERLPDGTYYSRVEPDHPLLPLLAPHFAARFADQRWLIHDLRRNTGVYYDGKTWVFLPEVRFPTPPEAALAVRDADETAYQDVWHEYFRTIAIEERRNPRLQRQRVPKRYWGNMTELRI